MDDRWNTLPNAPLVLEHDDDSRPAWLWSQDGLRLIWSNRAAGLVLARIKKHGLKRAAPAIPIKGQVARIIRLGAQGRSSLARIQFIAGERPLSLTCITTPLAWQEGQTALLIVGVDPIAAEILAADTQTEPAPPPEAPEVREAPPVPHDADEGEVAPHAYEHELASWQAADAETAYDAEAEMPVTPVAPTDEADNPSDWHAALEDDSDTGAAPETVDTDGPDGEEAEGILPSGAGRLSALVDRLAQDDALYSPLGEEDDHPPVGSSMPPSDGDLVQSAELPPALDASEESMSDPELFDSGTDAEVSDETAPQPDARTLFKVTGRGFTPSTDTRDFGRNAEAADGADEDNPAPSNPQADDRPEDRPPNQAATPTERFREALSALTSANPPDPDAVERTSRYNFDELSRILNDRVGDRNIAAEPEQNNVVSVRSDSTTPAAAQGLTGSLVNLGGETLVLNRLPLGIMVFRDQNILFANRAITEMIGYDSADALRQAGLAAVFPAADAEGQEAGPINHLVQRSGTLVPVTARLQSVSWQGRPALMLSASTTEVRTGHEDAVRAFAENFADLRGDGFIEANRNGTISAANASAAALLTDGKPVVGKTLAGLVGDDDVVALQAFLERPARFAETARPCLSLRAADGRSEIMLFALGQAGILSGYFGFVRARQTAPVRSAAARDVDPALLSRISRGVRRPLNTIIGFSDLIRAEAFGALSNERYEGYAQDISRAGHEIAALVDELDDYARLRDGRYLPQRASLDLTALLESCVVRIRGQANAARVIVRNAISETLPRITADRPSLAQAVLNLLSSAIDQTPTGATVVISAQRLDDDGIAIHVRDSSAHAVDMAERFVVFRDGMDKDGKALAPIRSSVGLALTRSLLAVNTVSLSVDPAGQDGMLFTLRIPADLIDERPAPENSQA